MDTVDTVVIPKSTRSKRNKKREDRKTKGVSQWKEYSGIVMSLLGTQRNIGLYLTLLKKIISNLLLSQKQEKETSLLIF